MRSSMAVKEQTKQQELKAKRKELTAKLEKEKEFVAYWQRWDDREPRDSYKCMIKHGKWTIESLENEIKELGS